MEAVAAFVDGELAPGPRTRAAQHVQQCAECATQVAAQTQARSALRTAGCPHLSSALLSSLRAIPQDTDLPGPPPGLAMTVDGQFVSVVRPDVHAVPFPPPAGLPMSGLAATAVPSGRPAEHHVGPRPARSATARQRRLRLGTGVAVSGLALGAIAFGAPNGPASPPPAPAVNRLPGSGQGAAGTPSMLDARFQVGRPSRPAVERANPAGFDR